MTIIIYHKTSYNLRVMLTLKIRLQLADAVLAVSELSQHAFNYTDYLVNFHMYVIIIALFLILFSTDQRNCCVKM